MFIRVLRLIVMFLVATLFSIFTGERCSMIKIHESGKASYTSYNTCVVHTDIPHDEFVTLTEWCNELHSQERP